MPATAAAQRRIAELVSRTPVHRAFHWLHLHQPQLRQWQLEMVRIPAPTFQESARAAWFLERFHQLGLTHIHQDDAGNVLAELGAPAAPETAHSTDQPSPRILLSAHLDTVFPASTSIEPTEEGPRIFAPGICDNAAGLTALLAIAAALRHAGIAPAIPILFAANTGEEGEGDLHGMRHLFERGPYRHSIAAAIALEGSGSSTVVTRALGSLRFRVTITGPGGHSWIDAGAPNPILVLAQLLTQIAALPLPSTLPANSPANSQTSSQTSSQTRSQTTINIGHISGGTSVNSIPESASALLDIRSTDPEQLLITANQVQQLIKDAISTAPAANTLAKQSIEPIGNRPAASLPHDSPLLHTVRAVDRHLNLRTEQRLASTDANIPLSRSIPAIAIGCGGTGGRIHTLQEWYDPTGRELALRRILLILLDTVALIAQSPAP